MLPMRLRRIQSAPNSTAPARLTAALAPVLNGNSNQIFGPEKNKAIEVGNKWELFDRHLLVTGALFQTDVTNARESLNVTAANPTARLPYNPAITGNVSCIIAGAAYQIRGIDLEVARQDHGQMERVRRPGADEIGGDEVARSPGQHRIVHDQCRPAARQHRAINPSACSANISSTDRWEIGGQAVYRSKIYGGTLLAANQGTSLPSYWRFDTFAEAKINKNWKVKLFVNNIFNKLYYDALYQSAAPFVLEAPGRTASLVISARF